MGIRLQTLLGTWATLLPAAWQLVLVPHWVAELHTLHGMALHATETRASTENANLPFSRLLSNSAVYSFLGSSSRLRLAAQQLIIVYRIELPRCSLWGQHQFCPPCCLVTSPPASSLACVSLDLSMPCFPLGFHHILLTFFSF